MVPFLWYLPKIFPLLDWPLKCFRSVCRDNWYLLEECMQEESFVKQGLRNIEHTYPDMVLFKQDVSMPNKQRVLQNTTPDVPKWSPMLYWSGTTWLNRWFNGNRCVKIIMTYIFIVETHIKQMRVYFFCACRGWSNANKMDVEV